MSSAERRNHLERVELRAIEDRDQLPKGTIGIAQGLAAAFGKRSEELYGFTEFVDPAAFNKTVGEADVMALWNHREDDLMARSASGTLRLQVDAARGLAYDFDVPDITCGRDLVVRLQRGDVRGSSFGFRTIRDEWHEDEQTGAVTRTLLEVALIDVSPVSRPAYVDTDVALRSLARATDTDFAEVRSLASQRQLGKILGGESVETDPDAEQRELQEEDEGRDPSTFVPARRAADYL